MKRLRRSIAFLLLTFLLFGWTEGFAADDNSTKTSRIEIVITVAGVKETVASIQESSRQIAALSRQLSDKEEFTDKDHELIAGLTQALNNNANAINNIATALPQQFDEAQSGITTLLNTAMVNAKEVVDSSKNDLIDPTLSRIENRLLVLVIVIAAVLFGLLWFGLWKLNAIVSTGSQTIGNIARTVTSLENVLEKINKDAESK